MRRTAVGLAVGVLLGGCADPYRSAPRPAAPPVSALSVAPAADAARTFALRWINWDWRDASTQQQVLSRLAAGELAVQLLANAASARIGASLQRDKPSRRGRVAAAEVRTAGAAARGLVVTREQSYTAGRADLGGSHYRVYLVRLVRRDARWEVSAWKPQP